MLRTLILTLNHNARWQVRNTDSGVGFVDVLTARAGGPEGINPQIVLIDVTSSSLSTSGITATVQVA